ncbi:MAG TPA: TadE/TadG family type IV pilus assembly protein [Pirellulaceae bacterium]|nr:TadE/TadG family type IV pilus assembly protein [Pirellulaceae bacterium]
MRETNSKAQSATALRAPRCGERARRGAAVVEFALMLPLLLILILGVCEIGRGVNAASELEASIRGAGRLACMDFRDMSPSGMTANQKIERDIRAFLRASGFPGNDVQITITHAGGEKNGLPFDLEDPENYLQLFRIEATLPYNKISQVPLVTLKDRNITASLVFRRGRVSML